MNNLSQAELNAIQQLDDNEYGHEAESYFEDEDEENDEDATYDEDDQALKRDEDSDND